MAVVGVTWFLGDLDHERSILFGPPLSAVGIAICAAAFASRRSALVAVLLHISAGVIVTVAGLFQWAAAEWGLAWSHSSSLQWAAGGGPLLAVVGIAWSLYALKRIA
jgi:hypothetical protein